MGIGEEGEYPNKLMYCRFRDMILASPGFCAKSPLGVESYVETDVWIDKFTYGGEKLAAQGSKVRKMQMQVLGGTTWPGHSRSIR